jgi:ornithine cyclodeaminase/alanine dehydrogenase
MNEIISALDIMFREKAEGRVEMPPKIGIHTMPDAFIHAMPAAIPAQKAAGMKWVGG